MTFEDSYGTPNSHTKYLGMDARIAEALDALGLAATVWTRYIYYGKDGEQELLEAKQFGKLRHNPSLRPRSVVEGVVAKRNIARAVDLVCKDLSNNFLDC